MHDWLEVGDDLTTYLNFYISEVENANEPEIVAGAATAVSDHYQALAIVELLLDANRTDFFHHLIRAAQVRVWLLSRFGQDSDTPTRYGVASKVRPFLCALAAEQRGLAHEIARLSPTAHQSSWEYEDDFLYANFLHRYVLGNDKGELAAILDRYVEVVGSKDSKAELCGLLLVPEPSAAAACFEKLIHEREEHIENIKRTSSYWDGGDPVLIPNGSIYIEGLAWLRVLANVGLDLEDEYRFCPSIARSVDYPRFVSTTFPYMTL